MNETRADKEKTDFHSQQGAPMTTSGKRAAQPRRPPGDAGSPSSSPLRLDFQSVQRILVTGHDGDRFVMTAREAAQACRSALDEKEWMKQFEDFLGHIHQWAKDHADVVMAAYVGISSEGLTGVVVTKGPEYQFDFDDEVTKLDIELANKFPNCRADILQSPEGEPEARIPYITLERALQVYGD